MRENLEQQQIPIYFGAVIVAALAAWVVPGTAALEPLVNPALALMLYATFLQVPLAALRQGLRHRRFLAALMLANFVVIPGLVFLLLPFAPSDATVRLGVLLVLLAPCIDYVVTFAHLGRGDARLLLAATPVLLLAQMALLPLYLGLFLGQEAARLIRPGPFVHAFVGLIVVPLALAALTQAGAARSARGARVAAALGLLPVPATALVLFVVVAATAPQLGPAREAALRVAALYVVFALLAPMLGWAVARGLRLDAPAARAVAFSAGTRNSLVVLPLALAVPGAAPVLPAVIVAQTLVELLAELVYVRVAPRMGRSRRPDR